MIQSRKKKREVGWEYPWQGDLKHGLDMNGEWTTSISGGGRSRRRAPGMPCDRNLGLRLAPPGSRLVSDPCLAPGSLSSLQAGVVGATPSVHPRLMSLSLDPCGEGLHVSSQTRLHLRLTGGHTTPCHGYSGTETGTAEAADRDSARLNGTRHSAPPNGRCIRRRHTSRACGRTGHTVESHSMLQSVEKIQLPKTRQCQEHLKMRFR